MKADVRDNARSDSPRGSNRRAIALRLARCGAALLALACGAPAQAQVAGSLSIESEDRYRGTGTRSAGAVVRASVMADSTSSFTSGAYAGLSGLWRTRDGGLDHSDALVGWSGRWNAIAPVADLDPGWGWGWDMGVHRTHYGDSSRYDFSEAMVGLLAPNASARVWWSPHYVGGTWASIYSEVDASHNFDEHWRAFGHLGALRYDNTGAARHVPGRTDALLGVGYVIDRFDLRLTRDGLVTGHAIGDIDTRRRRGAWVLGASVAF